MKELWYIFINGAFENSGAEKSGGRISDEYAQRILEEARDLRGKNRTVACQRLYDDLQQKVNTYKATMLFDGQNADREGGQRSEQADPSARVTPSVDAYGQRVFTITVISSADATPMASDQSHLDDDDVQTQWQSLADSIRGSAERMWRDMFLFLDMKESPPKATCLLITRISQQLMLLWLEAVLYQDRAYSNFLARSMSVSTEGGESTRENIRKHVKQYHDTIKRWDNELKRSMSTYKENRVRAYFRSHQLESQQLRRLIRQFADLNALELGWASQVTDAEAELRYQQRDALRREYLTDGSWLSIGNRLASFGMFVLRITTGYGTKPMNFLITAVSFWVVDGLLFFFNDYFHDGLISAQHFCVESQPHIQIWQDVVGEVVRYAYIALTNLTSLGINSSLATYCNGVYSEAVITFSTLSGYFMLGLLSAVLYTQLTQRD